MMVAFGSNQVSPSLLHVLASAAADGKELALATVDRLRKLQPRTGPVNASHGDHKIVVPLDELAGFDREQRRAALDVIAGLRNQLADAAGVGREDRGGGV